MSVLNGYFLTVLPQAVFRTQPKVYGEAFLQKQLTTLAVKTFFAKKLRHKCLTVFQKCLCCP